LKVIPRKGRWVELCFSLFITFTFNSSLYIVMNIMHWSRKLVIGVFHFFNPETWVDYIKINELVSSLNPVQ